MNEEQNKENQMNDWFDKYKTNYINKKQKEILKLKEESGQSIWMHRIGGFILDLISWTIIAYFVYIWWQVGRNDFNCTLSMCNSLYSNQNVILNTTIETIKGGLNNISI